MAGLYLAVSDRGRALYGEEPFEAEFAAAEERDLVDAGHVVPAPRPYRVLSNNYSAGAQGDVVDLALLVEHEAALIQGGHIERAARPANKKG